MANNKLSRKYPPFYEKFVPVAIGLLVFVLAVMLVFTLAVGVGVLNFE